MVDLPVELWLLIFSYLYTEQVLPLTHMRTSWMRAGQCLAQRRLCQFSIERDGDKYGFNRKFGLLLTGEPTNDSRYLRWYLGSFTWVPPHHLLLTEPTIVKLLRINGESSVNLANFSRAIRYRRWVGPTIQPDIRKNCFFRLRKIPLSLLNKITWQSK